MEVAKLYKEMDEKVDLIHIHRLRPNFEIGSLARRNN